MIPATGPRTAAYPPSHPKMNVLWLASSFQGIMATPMKQVITPPSLNEIFFGQRLEKSLAGGTTLAPMFTLRVARRIASSEIAPATGQGKGLSGCPGPQIADQ